MYLLRWLGLSLILASAFIEPSSAQARALLLFGQAGRMYPLANLSSLGDDMSPGRSFGGGVGLQLGPTTAIRGLANISKSTLRGTTASLSDPHLTRSYYGLDLMFGTPSDVGFAPYIFFGGGCLSGNPVQPGIDTFTKVAARAGTGVNYVPDNSFFVLFLEAGGWLYEFELLGFEELQFNAAFIGGLAFAIPF